METNQTISSHICRTFLFLHIEKIEFEMVGVAAKELDLSLRCKSEKNKRKKKIRKRLIRNSAQVSNCQPVCLFLPRPAFVFISFFDSSPNIRSPGKVGGFNSSEPIDRSEKAVMGSNPGKHQY